ncbi:MAG: beta strand repeat-containing protein [Chthoniobacteraceae bacterium]
MKSALSKVTFGVIFSLSSLFGPSAFSADYTWTGGSGGTADAPVTGSWSYGASWSGGAAPATKSSATAGNTFYFGGSGSTSYIATENIGTNYTNVLLCVQTLTLNSSATVTEGIASTNGLYFYGGGAGAQIIQNGSGAFNISAPLKFADVTTFSGTGSGKVTLGGQITSGSLIINQTGGATLQLSFNNNLFNGTNDAVTLNAGTLDLAAAGALGGAGTTTGANLILNGGTLLSSNGTTLNTLINRTITIGGDITLGGSANWSLGATAVSLTGNRTITANTLGTTGATIAGAISDAGAGYSLTIGSASAGTLTLSGSNSYSGGTTLSGGKLNLTNAYALGTGTLTITGGSFLTSSGSAITLATNNAQVWSGDFSYTGGTLNMGTGAVTMTASRTLTVSGGNLTIGGVISGAGYNLTKSGYGVLTLTGNNTFTGALVVTSGSVVVNSLANGGVASSIGAGPTSGWALQLINGATLVYTGTGSTTNRQMYIDTAGTIDNEGTGALVFSNSGGAIVNNNNGAGNASRTITLTGTNADNNTMALQINDPTAGKTTSLVKGGSGYWWISGTNNTYSGTTSVQNGTLAFSSVASGTSGQSLGSSNTVNLGVASTSSGILQYTGGAGILDKNIYALGNGLNTIKNSGTGLLTLSGSLVKNGTVLVLDGGTAGVNVTGTISGSIANSDLYITGGTTTLSAVNTYNGPTWVYGGGVLVDGVSNALPTATNLILGGTDNSNGTFDLNGNNQTVAGLSGTGTGTKTVTNNGASTSTLTVTGGGAYSGLIADGSGITALTVSGGNLVLGGVNTYTGATAIIGGTLSVNGSLANTTVNVSSTATLNGSGTVGGAVNDYGTISGGLTFNNDVTVHAGATASAAAFNGNITDNGSITGGLAVRGEKVLSGSGSVSGAVTVNGGTVNGSGLSLGATVLNGSSTLSGYNIASSVTIASGTTSLSGTTKSNSALSVSADATLNANGTIDGSATISGWLKGNSTVTGGLTMDSTSTLVTEVSGAVAGISYNQVNVKGDVSLAGTLDLTKLSGLTLGSTITLIDNTGSGTTTGYFSTILTSGSTYSLTSNADNTFTVSGTEYLLSYSSNADGDGQFNDVTLTVVPEASTWAMLVGGIGLLGFGQKLRRRMV